MFEQLKKYDKIGHDFDDSLIDHYNSPAFWRFIEENPYNQEHHIITFRSGGLEKRIFADLALRGSQLKPHHFTGVHNIPHEMWQEHTMNRDLPAGFNEALDDEISRLRGGASGLVASLSEIADDPYVVWKGAKCSELGIPVLIDDATHKVKLGCAKYQIDHFHPDDLLQ